MFDTLWNNAIPAQEKIKEIEEGIKTPFTETLRDPLQIQKLIIDFVTSAKQEVLMLLFPHITIGDTFLGRQEEGSGQKIIDYWSRRYHDMQ